MDCLGCIFISTENLAYLIKNTNIVTGFMVSLFLAAPAPRVRRALDLMGTSERNGVRFFFCFGKSTFLYRSQLFLLLTFLGTFVILYELQA